MEREQSRTDADAYQDDAMSDERARERVPELVRGDDEPEEHHEREEVGADLRLGRHHRHDDEANERCDDPDPPQALSVHSRSVYTGRSREA